MARAAATRGPGYIVDVSLHFHPLGAFTETPLRAVSLAVDVTSLGCFRGFFGKRDGTEEMGVGLGRGRVCDDWRHRRCAGTARMVGHAGYPGVACSDRERNGVRRHGRIRSRWG